MSVAIPEEVDRVISELVAILEPDHDWQAGVLIRLKQAVNTGDFHAVKEQFASGDLWGGAGSVWDVSFVDSAVNERKCELEIELVDAFARAGIANNAAYGRAEICRRWIAGGVFRPPST